MSGRSSMQGEAAVKFYRFKPVFFNNHISAVSPSLKVGADTKTTNDNTNLFLHPDHRFIVKMIPMIVRDNQVINCWEIISRIHICSRKAARSKCKRRRCSAEYRINENTFAVKLREV